MEKQNNLRFKIYPNPVKKSKKTGLIPIYLKLTYKKKKSETRLSTDFDLNDEALKLWDYRNMLIDSRKYNDLNDNITELKAECSKYIKSNKNIPNNALYKILNIVTNKEDIDLDITVLKYCKNYIDEINKTNKIKVGTKINYKKAVNHLEKFLKSENNEKMILKDFGYEEAKKFDRYMSSIEGANNQATSITGNIIKLKTIFKEAIREKKLNDNPFDNIKLCYTSSFRTPYLTIEDFNKLISNEYIKNNRELSFYRDLFIFGVFTGLSVIDLQKIENKNFYPVFQNRMKLDIKRTKTDIVVNQILPLAAQKILNKYKGMKTDYIFPKFFPQTYNKKLKIISGIMSLNITLTSKVSRTTCNQNLINIGSFDHIYKNVYMGWTNSKNISNVYTTIEDKILLRNADNIEKYFMEHLSENYLNLI